ncbi:MAG: hypothetical protein Q8R08_01285, partial [bacterium]|nr:hypothetical protein [bacterium]
IESEEKHLQGAGENKKLQTEISELYRQRQKLALEQVRLGGELQTLKIQGSAIPRMNWSHFKGKFRTAFDKLRQLLQNFGNFKTNLDDLQKEIQSAEALFQTIWREIESDDGHENGDKEEKLRAQLKDMEQDIEKIASQISAVEKKQHDSLSEEQLRRSQLFVKDRLLRNKQETLVRTKDTRNQLAVEAAKFEARKEATQQEAKNELGAEFEQLIHENKDQFRGNTGALEKITSLKKQLMDIGGVDDMVQKEYEETENRFQYLTAQSQDLEKGIADLKAVIAELDEIIKKQFQEAFKKISEKFSEYFRMLFSGGKATMSLVREKPNVEEQIEEEDSTPSQSPPSHGGEAREIAGIEIRATPPGKRLGGISALSGGERALTSIALLCSLLSAYPSPFVVLDEVDAALDEANSIRFGKILGTLANRTQFITITHNRETMRQSHTLYGVTMRDDGVSKILSLKLPEAAVYSS